MIEGFAKEAALGPPPTSAHAEGPIRLEASLLNADEVVDTMAEAGWARTSRTTFAIDADAWRSAANGSKRDRPLQGLLGAVLVLFRRLRPSSRESALAYPRPPRGNRRRRAIVVDQDSPEWFEPSDGMGPGGPRLARSGQTRCDPPDGPHARRHQRRGACCRSSEDPTEASSSASGPIRGAIEAELANQECAVRSPLRRLEALDDPDQHAIDLMSPSHCPSAVRMMKA